MTPAPSSVSTSLELSPSSPSRISRLCWPSVGAGARALPLFVALHAESDPVVVGHDIALDVAHPIGALGGEDPRTVADPLQQHAVGRVLEDLFSGHVQRRADLGCLQQTALA